jgi:hypothetical protein
MQTRINPLDQAGARSSPLQISWQWLAVVGFVFMEISTIVPWVLTLNASIAGAGQMVVLITSCAIVLSTLAVVRLIDALALKNNLQRVILFMLLALDLYLGLRFLITDVNAGSFRAFSTQAANSVGDFLNMIPAWFIAMILVIGLWWHGLRLAKQRVGPIKVFNQFRWGIVLFGLFALSGFLVPMARDVDPTRMLFSFLFFGLISLVAARVSILSFLRGGSYDPFDRRWLLAILLSTLGFVLLAYGVGAVTTGQAAIFFGIIGGLFVAIGLILAAPLLLVLYLISPAINSLSESLPTPEATQTGMEMPEIGEISGGGTSGFMSWANAFSLSQEARLVLMLLGIMALVIFLIWSFRWINGQNRANNGNQESESLLDRQEILNHLRKMLQNRLQRADPDSSRSQLTAAERRRAAERIRVIYAELLALAEVHGYARADSVTPLEFSNELDVAFPGNVSEIEQITQAYLNVRYGELPETASETAALEADWQSIQEKAAVKAS